MPLRGKLEQEVRRRASVAAPAMGSSSFHPCQGLLHMGQHTPAWTAPRPNSPHNSLEAEIPSSERAGHCTSPGHHILVSSLLKSLYMRFCWFFLFACLVFGYQAEFLACLVFNRTTRDYPLPSRRVRLYAPRGVPSFEKTVPQSWRAAPRSRVLSVFDCQPARDSPLSVHPEIPEWLLAL